MKEEMLNYQPGHLLDEWLRHTGNNKNRKPTGNTTCYVKVEVLGDDGEWNEKWLPVFVGEDALDGLQEAYMMMIRRWHDEWEEGKGRDSTKICALLVMTYGEGMVRRNPDKLDTPEEELDQELLAYSKEGFVPARIVSVISMLGTASESTMFFDQANPLVERFETVANDDDTLSTTGKLAEHGDLDQALMMTFTLLVLLGAAADDGQEPSVASVLRKAKEFRHHEGGAEVWEMMKTFASKLDGLREEAERMKNLSDEIRGIIDDE